MILPSKHISQEKALLTVGASILKSLGRPKTVSTVWEGVRLSSQVNYDWFVLTLDLLYVIDAIEIHDGLLIRKNSV